MTEQELNNIRGAAKHFQNSANKVQDGIDNVLEPGVKDARISAEDTRRMMEMLSKRVTALFGLSVLINLVSLTYVVGTQ